MSTVWIRGLGAVSPAGWGMPALRQAIDRNEPLAGQTLDRPGWTRGLQVRRVPTPTPRPAFLGHPRLRRTSPISHYAMASVLEAMGEEAEAVKAGGLRLGIVLCVMSGCVNYSRRFYDEVLKDPATASPLIFPETVFNAPASHLSAWLGASGINYTLVGDPGSFPLGLVVAADWLANGLVDRCVVVGAEELDWLTADAFRLFTRRMIVSEGAAALYLTGERVPGAVRLGAISDVELFANRSERTRVVRAAAAAAGAWAAKAGAGRAWFCDGRQGVPWLDDAEAVGDPAGALVARRSPRRVLGEGLMAAAAWQCVDAVDTIARSCGREVERSVALLSGINEQVMWVGFERKAPDEEQKT